MDDSTCTDHTDACSLVLSAQFDDQSSDGTQMNVSFYSYPIIKSRSFTKYCKQDNPYDWKIF